MMRVAGIGVLLVLAISGCKSRKSTVQEAASEPAVEEAEPVKLNQAENPTVLNLLVTLTAKEGVESIKLDSVFEKPGKLNQTPVTIDGSEHRLRLVFKSEDGTKKIYQWMRHPLFLRIPIPAKDGEEATTMEVNTESAQIYISAQKEPWFHTVVFESFPPRQARKEIGSVVLK